MPPRKPLENEPAKAVEEFLASLTPLEGRGVFTPEQRDRLRAVQRGQRGENKEPPAE
jgi:hypothetical protein